MGSISAGRVHRGSLLVMAWVMVAMLVGACAAPAEEVTDGSTEPAAASESASDGEAASGEPIRLGLNLEQSGASSVVGQANINGAELHAEIINGRGGILGRPVELVLEDNATDESQTITIARRFADDDSIAAVIGPGTSPTTLAAMDVILESGKPTFSLASSTAIVTPVEERPNVFKMPANNEVYAEVAAADMARRGISRIGVIAVNNPYGDAGLAAWDQIVESGDGPEIVGSERFEATDTDMTAQLNNLVDAGAEALAVVSIAPGAPTIQRNATENLGLEIPIYYDAGAGAELFLELAGDAAEGMLMAHPSTLVWDQVEGAPNSDVLQEFGSAYTEQFGNISGFAGYGWDALGIFAAAVEQAGSLDPAAVTEAVENLGEYSGVNGVYEISDQDHQGLNADDNLLLTVEGGEWRIVDGG